MTDYIFKCKECGEIRTNLGALHSHIDRHLPVFTKNVSFSVPTAKYEERTKVLEITETEEVDFEELEGYPSRNGVVDYFTGILRLKT